MICFIRKGKIQRCPNSAILEAKEALYTCSRASTACTGWCTVRLQAEMRLGLSRPSFSQSESLPDSLKNRGNR
jgi:hypothetical protein